MAREGHPAPDPVMASRLRYYDEDTHGTGTLRVFIEGRNRAEAIRNAKDEWSNYSTTLTFDPVEAYPTGPAPRGVWREYAVLYTGEGF